MTKFAELCAQFVAWDTALTQYDQKAQMVMLAFYGPVDLSVPGAAVGKRGG